MLVQGNRGLSNLVAYVLLIGITISLSVVVYAWLKFYVTEGDVTECPDNVNLIMSSYNCVAGGSGYLNLTLKNKGLFSVDGYVVSVHNRTGAEFGLYTIETGGEIVGPGGTSVFYYNLADDGFDDLTLVDIGPYILDEDGDVVNCESYVVQEIKCN